MDSRLERFRRQQKWRAKPEFDPSIARDVSGFIKEQTRLSKALGNVAEAFEAIVPADIAKQCTLVGVKGGVLTIQTNSSGARFALDRLMRGGTEASLRERAAALGTRLVRVRVMSSSE